MKSTIDPVKTGQKLKKMLNNAGYSVKFIQEYLNLSCPQSIYRWFKGKILPSVEHLCALSVLLDVHMEDLLVLHFEPMQWTWEIREENANVRIFKIHQCFERVLMVA